MWNDKVLWGCRSSLGMTWNEFSWWVMGAWTHILFSFSIQIDFHIGACLLQLIHLVCTPFAEASGRKHWLKGPIPGVMWGSGKTALVWENRRASPLSFLRNSRMRAPLSTAPDVVNQKFGTFELKCNPLKFSWANQTLTKVSLCNRSCDFLNEAHPELCGSVPSEMMHRTVNFLTTQWQDARRKVPLHASWRDWSSGHTL